MKAFRQHIVPILLVPQSMLTVPSQYGRLLVFLFFLLMTLSQASFAKVKVSVEGTSKTFANNITAHLGKLEEDQLIRPQTLERQLGKAVSSAARAIGYYDSSYVYRIEKNKLTLTVQAGIRAKYIDPILEIHGDAASVKAFRRAKKHSKLKAGKPLSHRQYDAYKQKILSLADEYGFFDGKFTTSEFRVDKAANTGQPVLIFESGQRYHFGTVRYEGSDIKDELLTRLLPFKQGDLVRGKVLLEVNRNLLDTNYFKTVDIRREYVRDTHVLNLLINIVESRKSRYEVGVGYSTDYGPRLLFGWEKPLINDHGHSLSVNSEWSAPKKDLQASYRIPWHNPLRQYIELSTGYQFKTGEDSETELVSSSLSYYDKRDSGWIYGYSWDFDLESYSQGGQDRRRVAYMLPGFNLSHATILEGRDPSHGHRFESYFRGSTRGLGADVDFFKSYASFRYLMPVFNRKTLLLLRGELGAIQTEDITKVPVTRRFYAGGDSSIRGYGYELVSSRDKDGALLGGRYLNTFSAELSYRVMRNWRVATFVDTGRAYNDQKEPFSTGVGIGLRWLSPVGQVRVDLAHPINDPDRAVMLHIGMGPPL